MLCVCGTVEFFVRLGAETARGPQAHDKTVMQALYAHVRAGQLEEAVDLCRKANQPWRAASIRGALLFQWRAVGE